MKDVCIIVPYRDRESHLIKFAPYINKFLTAEKLTFDIMIVEQSAEKPFNRAKLLNIGYAHSKTEEWAKNVSEQSAEIYSNYVFHDVDMLPVFAKASYRVAASPTHYAAIVEQFGWALAYEKYVGGVTCFDADSFEKINGFSNEYFSWGAEDDDLYNRCKAAGIIFNRRNNMYSSLSHERPIISNLYQNNLSLLENWEKRMYTDGLNNLNYDIIESKKQPEFSQIKVNL